jgi:hypothetical protein
MAKIDNPQAIAQKWATAMSAATPAYEAGINGVTTAPGAAAAAASAKYLAGVQANVAKFERNSLSVDLATWKTAAIQKGGPRLASGAAAAQGKVAAFDAAFFAYLKQGQAQIDNMPTLTYDQRKLKAIAQMDWNHAFPGYR